MSLSESREDWIAREARKRPLAERSSFLDGACAGDAALRKRLEAVLAAPDPRQAGNSDETEVARPTLKIDFADTPSEVAGQTIGRYKILQKIGEGGCGVVYMAEQEQPVRRRVALKVIKLGMDTKEVIARFEAERQALALMDHPNIAKVLDAGSTEAGRPYFVMELVRGIKFTEYCDQNHLGIRQRLELFIQICQAIQHAHQKGIIHRDIKPSNILVTLHDGVPVPKVIDFGIAKATTDQRLTDKTLFTAYEQFIGTPAYMSPEQAEMSGLDIDTRSDIYSLGVLLYELLSGKTPFDPKELIESGLEAMRRTIREKDPVRPSTRVHTLSGEELTTTAKRHGVEAQRLMSQLRGDLDWIVMKCLEKDRTRRYETANGLAMDLKRHLNNEPVLARPPGKLYEFQKTFRRHRVGFVAAGAVMAALAVGATLTTWQAVRAIEAAKKETLARMQADQAARLAETERERAAKGEQKARASELAAREAGEAARQNLYAADMLLAQQAVGGNDLGRARSLLDRHRPKSAESDLRGWEWRYLWSRCRSDELFILGTCSNAVGSVTWYHDGRHILTTDQDQTLKLWDVLTRKEIARVAVNARGRQVVAISPDNRIVATGSVADGTNGLVRFWEGSTLRELAPPLVVPRIVEGAAFEPGGKTLLTVGGGAVITWDVETRREVRQQQIPPGRAISEFAPSQPLSADQRIVALWQEDGRILLWDRAKEHAQATLFGPALPVTFTFSPDGRQFAASFMNSEVRIWTVATGELVGTLTNHVSFVPGLSFSPDGALLATGGYDQVLRLWDTVNWQGLATLRGHEDEIWATAFAPDGKSIATAARDETVRIWSAIPNSRLPERFVLPENLQLIAFSPSGEHFATVAQGVTRIIESRFLREKSAGQISTNEILSGALSPGATFLAIGLGNGAVEVWNCESWSRTANLEWEGIPVTSLAFSPTGNALAGCSSNGRVRIWGFPDQSVRVTLDSHQSRLDGLQFSPNGARLAAAGDRAVRVWNLATGDQEFVLQGHKGRVTSLAFSQDGRFLATASHDGTARVWDLAANRELVQLRSQLTSVYAVAFSPDCKRLATGNGDGPLKLYDPARQQELAALGPALPRGFRAVFFLDDDTILARAMNQIIVWRASSWPEIELAEKSAGAKAQ